MPTFDTPEPIVAAVEFELGRAHITASPRSDTVVTVRPSDPADDLDVRAAQRTTVTYSSGRLSVRGPRNRVRLGRPGSIEVHVDLPAGSRLRGTVAKGDFTGVGRLGDAVLATAAGSIRLDEADAVEARTGHGHISVTVAHAGVDARTAHGDIRIGALARGSTVLHTAVGNLDVGVRGSCAARVDAQALVGRVRNSVVAGNGEPVAVQARTTVGNIVIRPC